MAYGIRKIFYFQNWSNQPVNGKIIRNRVFQPGSVPNLPEPMHGFQGGQVCEHRPQQHVCAGQDVRLKPVSAPADPSQWSEQQKSEQLRQNGQSRKARHDFYPQGYSQVKAAPADQRASFRYHQAL